MQNGTESMASLPTKMSTVCMSAYTKSSRELVNFPEALFTCEIERAKEKQGNFLGILSHQKCFLFVFLLYIVSYNACFCRMKMGLLRLSN